MMDNKKHSQKIDNGTICKNLIIIDRFFKEGGLDSEIYLGHYLSNFDDKVIIKLI